MFEFSAEDTVFYHTVGGRLCQRVDLTIRCGKAFEGTVEIDAGKFGRETTAIACETGRAGPVIAYAPAVYPNIAGGRHEPVSATVRIWGDGVEASGVVMIGRHRPWTVYLMSDICADYTWGMPGEDTMEASGRVIDYHLGWMDKTDGLPEGDRDRFNFNQTDELLWYIQRKPKAQAEKLFGRVREGRFQVSPSFNSCLTSLVHTEQLIRSLYYGRALEREYGADISVDQQIETPTCTWGFAGMLADAGVRYFIRNWLSYYSPYNDDRDPYPLFRWAGPDGRSVIVASDRAACLRRNYAQGGMFIHETYGEIVRELHEWWIPNFEGNEAYPYDALPLFGAHSDLHRDTSAEIATILSNVSRYNAEPWEYPRIVNATWNQYFRHIERWHERNAFELPVLKGDWGTSWEEWPAGVAHILAGMRGNVNRFLALEQLVSVAAAGRPGFVESVREELGTGLLKMEQIAEHPWNGSSDREREDSNRRRVVWNVEMERNNESLLDKAAAALFGRGACKAGGCVAAFNALSWDCDRLIGIKASESLEAVDVLSGEPLPSFYDEGAGELRVLAKGLPATGCRLLRLKKPENGGARTAVPVAGNAIENEYYKVTADIRNGGIAGILDKRTGRELANRTHPYKLNQFLYLSQQAEYTGETAPAALAPGRPYTVKVKTSWNQCVETPYEERDSARFLRELPGYADDQKVTLVEYEECTLRDILVEVEELPGFGSRMTIRGSAKGVSVETVITLINGVDAVEIENRVRKQAASEPQEVHFAFPFDVPGGRCLYDGPGAIIRPESVAAGGDHLNGSGRQMYAAQSFADVSNGEFGVTLAQADSSLVQFGRRTTREYPLSPDVPDNTILALVMTNKQPEMRQNQAGNERFAFRFSIRFHEGGRDAVRAYRFGQELNVPALCIPAEESALTSDEPVKSFVRLDREDVAVSALKPAEADDISLILRLRDIGGRGGAVRADVSALKPVQAWRADLLERDTEEAKIDGGAVRCEILPYGWATLRLRTQ